MAAILTDAPFGRIATMGGDVTAILVTISGNGSTYTTASGGLPIDLVAIIAGGVAIGSGAAQFSAPYLNPADVVGIVPLGLSTNGFLPGGFILGTPTYAAAAYPFRGGDINAIHPVQQLATCPATVRLYGIGAANAPGSALGEVANGANTDSFTALLYIARGGTNA